MKVHIMSTLEKPKFRNISLLQDVPSYRLPVSGWVSILHRISGVIMFFLLPFVIWMFDASVSSQISFGTFTTAFGAGLWGVPGFVFKLVALGLIWAYLHHLIAGLRHLWMDVCHQSVNKKFGTNSAIFVLCASLGLTAALGAKLFGLY